ncbi:MAG TPA: DUF6677 family protein [Planctomycetaceae bacterium]|nr:DUF6677 family protein [Planctomycetaceae bacterium]
MPQTRVKLKDPMFAALLAFLVPGLGHFYQRRMFKAALYAVCILGTFFTGMRIGHGQVVYFHWQNPENRTYAYLCQFWVGLPALPALGQAYRSSRAFDVNYVPRQFQTQFDGTLVAETRDRNGTITGTIELGPQEANMPHVWTGQLKGTLTTANGAVGIEGEVTPGSLDPEVAPTDKRRLVGTFEGRIDGELVRGRLEGDIPRPMWNAYEAPLRDVRVNDFAGEQTDLDRAHFLLGSRFELGVVFTMIAGLLNILAIYDALEGPAYEIENEEREPGGHPPQPAPA